MQCGKLTKHHQFTNRLGTTVFLRIPRSQHRMRLWHGLQLDTAQWHWPLWYVRSKKAPGRTPLWPSRGRCNAMVEGNPATLKEVAIGSNNFCTFQGPRNSFCTFCLRTLLGPCHQTHQGSWVCFAETPLIWNGQCSIWNGLTNMRIWKWGIHLANAEIRSFWDNSLYANHHSSDMVMSLLEFVQNRGHGIFVKNDHWGSLFSNPSPNVGWLQKARPCEDFAIPIQRSSSCDPTLKIWSQNVPATPRRRDRVSMTPKKGSLVSRKFVETTHGQRSLETTLGAINTLVYIYIYLYYIV